MKKPTKLYNVYLVREGYKGPYEGQYYRELLGQTRAVSARQACNNLRFRREGKTTNSWTVEDYLDDSAFVICRYEAEEVTA